MRDWAFQQLVKSLLKNKVEVVHTGEVNPEEVIFLDARTREEYEVSHLPNAIWVGYDEFDLSALELEKDQDFVVYCSLGKRSEDIGVKLLEAGYPRVKNLFGGIFQWANEGRQLSDSSGSTNKVHTYSKSWGIWVKKGEKVN